MTEIDGAIYDGAVLRTLEDALGEDVVRGLIDAFEADLATRPGIISRQIAEGDISGARANAHALKGAALIVGAPAIAAAATLIEGADARRLANLAKQLMTLPRR